MKNLLLNRNYSTIIFLILILPFLSCSSKDKIKEEPDYVAKVVCISCGGTVVQLLNSDSLGETWTNFFITPNKEYKNCILVNLNSSFAKTDSIFGLNLRFVDYFSSGYFCDIGGLPKTKAEIQELFEFTKL